MEIVRQIIMSTLELWMIDMMGIEGDRMRDRQVGRNQVFSQQVVAFGPQDLILIIHKILTISNSRYGILWSNKMQTEDRISQQHESERQTLEG